jgi:hypothetical protein
MHEETRAKLLEKTWAKYENIVFITDNPESSLKHHIFIGDYIPGLTYHPKNVLKMFRLFLDVYDDYDFFMMVDDDSYVYVEKLKLYLSFFDKDDNYMIGDFLNWIPHKLVSHPHLTTDYNEWPGGGSGLVFTKKCIQTFLSLAREFNIPYENHDVWLHRLYMLSDKRTIKRVHCPGFHQYNSKNLLCTPVISVHLEHDMNRVYDWHLKDTP